MAAGVTVFSTPWCGYCVRLKRQLAGMGVTFTEVDIERDADSAEVVMAANGGMRTVPTVLFDDGTTLSNPTAREVAERLAACA